MKILTKALINKMERCSALANKHNKLIREIDMELIEKGVDINKMRCIYELYADVVEYGGALNVTDMEKAMQRNMK